MEDLYRCKWSGFLPLWGGIECYPEVIKNCLSGLCPYKDVHKFNREECEAFKLLEVSKEN